MDISNNGVRLSNKVFRNMYERYKAFEDKYKREPDIIHLTPDKASDYVTARRFRDMMDRVLRYPKGPEVWINKTGSPVVRTSFTPAPPVTKEAQEGVYKSPRYIKYLDQETNYYCGPYMTVQIIYELYGYKAAQKALAIVEGTTTSGTGHPGIETGFKKLAEQIGKKVSVKWVNFSSLGDTTEARFKKLGEYVEDPEIGAGLHIKYRNKWGHYTVPVVVDTVNKKIAITDSLNPEDILWVTFKEMAEWIANTTGNQPSVCLVTAQ